jgi:hypothetical protein
MPDLRAGVAKRQPYFLPLLAQRRGKECTGVCALHSPGPTP